MFPNPTSTTLILSILGVLTFSIIMLLPALLELKKPKDSGPRKIMDDAYITHYRMAGAVLMIKNLEEDYRFDQKPTGKIMDIIAVLPNLEV